MTPEDQALLVIFGQQTLLEIIDVIMSSFYYGVCLLGACVLTAWILPSPEQGRSKIFIGSFVAILISFTWGNIIINAFAAIQARYGMMEQLHEGLEAQGAAAAAKSVWWDYVNPWPVTINLLLGDYIVAWRAWILSQKSRFWKVLLAGMTICNTVLNIADCIWANVTLHEMLSLQFGPLDWLSLTFSLAINLISTLLISWKAWKHYSNLSGSSYTANRTLKLLLLLVESGGIFCLLQLANLIFDIFDTSPVISAEFSFNIASLVFNNTLIGFSALYPIAVFLLIQSNTSPVIETFHSSQSPAESDTITGNHSD
ncbi:hypothetical protein GYMLUDRAFT_249207 [Collybiopsis luxurians FD-317 M1]|uniref:Uncharacterized protein n=1 Tax=Collybiopsis luxurians FD-317 M1 TaxID=944289 RepID=A0A0D0CIP0_9AGAR|nr:hypothetical protein GYMLUDRAFT_249207 [Collybiopsis luxurians FD-317 M1]